MEASIRRDDNTYATLRVACTIQRQQVQQAAHQAGLRVDFFCEAGHIAIGAGGNTWRPEREALGAYRPTAFGSGGSEGGASENPNPKPTRKVHRGYGADRSALERARQRVERLLRKAGLTPAEALELFKN